MTRERLAVSRDTRLLLAIIVIAVVTLWALARLRFSDRLSTPNPVPPVLAQLAPRSALEDIAGAVADVASRVQPWVATLQAETREVDGGVAPVIAALRLTGDRAVALAARPLLPPFETAVLARDPASHLAVVRLADPSAVGAVATWTPRYPVAPRFLFAAHVSASGVSLRPVFVGALHEFRTPIWPDPVWTLPDDVDLSAGTLLFTHEGAFAGLVDERAPRRLLVPAQTVVATAERLSKGTPRPGWLGVGVQPLTRATAAAAGANVGLIVNWVETQGPAADLVRVGDVIETVDGAEAGGLDVWTARVARLAEGESILARVRRADGTHEVSITAAAPPSASTARRPLGLTLRAIAGQGLEVTHLDPSSAAAAAGLRAGDLLTAVGDAQTTHLQEARRLFANASRTRPLMVAYTRGASHFVTAIERTW